MFSVMEKEEEEEHKPEKWRCPQCGNTIRTHVPLTSTPTCHNPKKHDRKKFIMEKVK